MLGGLKRLAGGDGLLIKHPGSIVSLLRKLHLGFRSTPRVVVISGRLQIVRFGIIDIRRLKIGQFLTLLDGAALSRI